MMDTRLMFDPVRMRLIAAISGQHLTTQQLVKAIPDIPQATPHRHIGALIQGGVLEIVALRKIRGVEERLLRMKGPPSIARQDLKGKTRAELERMAVVFISGLPSDIRRYLRGRKKPDPFRDGVQRSTVTLHLDDAELAMLNDAVVRLILDALNKKPVAGRKGRIFSDTIILSE
jgi:hypothetical protein